MLRKSIVLTALLPSAIESADEFDRAAALLKQRGVELIEFYAPAQQAALRRDTLRRLGLSGVYLAAYYQKRNGVNFASPDEDERRRAVELSRSCIDTAKDCGVEAVLISAGSYPGKAQEEQAWISLEKSIRELLDYAGDLKILMEPGDRDVDAKQLAGPTDRTVEMVARICADRDNFSLVMDTSHLAQLGEDARKSLELARPYCRHIHLANCVLIKGDPLYGDRHPLFNQPGASYTAAELELLAGELAAGYCDPLTLSIEMICHSDDEQAYFAKALAEEAWFFNM